MEIFLSVGVILFNISLGVFIITFLSDLFESKLWKVFVIVFILTLLLNSMTLISLI